MAVGVESETVATAGTGDVIVLATARTRAEHELVASWAAEHHPGADAEEGPERADAVGAERLQHQHVEPGEPEDRRDVAEMERHRGANRHVVRIGRDVGVHAR